MLHASGVAQRSSKSRRSSQACSGCRFGCKTAAHSHFSALGGPCEMKPAGWFCSPTQTYEVVQGMLTSSSSRVETYCLCHTLTPSARLAKEASKKAQEDLQRLGGHQCCCNCWEMGDCCAASKLVSLVWSLEAGRVPCPCAMLVGGRNICAQPGPEWHCCNACPVAPLIRGQQNHHSRGELTSCIPQRQITSMR